MQKIIPHLWYDKEAKEAAAFYTSAFQEVFGSTKGESTVTTIQTIHDTPSGSVDTVTMSLVGQEFMLISAGPYFKFTPAISFLVACEAKEQVDALWKKLFEGGSALMELNTYPFSERYGWLKDKYGLTWQIMFTGDREITQRITPTLMFVGDNAGKAEEAMSFYTSLFPDSKVGEMMRYGSEQTMEKAEAIARGAFTLAGQEFAAMDSSFKHEFTFNEAISLLVRCDTQEEIDYYWEKMSAVPESEQCGWLKDRYGLSWQISPTVMEEMMRSDDRETLDRVTQSFLKMKKFDLAELERVYRGT